MTRRDLLAASAMAPALLSAQAEPKKVRKGRLKQGVCAGVFGPDMPFEQRVAYAAQLGCYCFDLRAPQDWPVLQKYGLVPTVVPGGGRLPDGCNDLKNHEWIEKQFLENIPRAGAAGVPNVITFSGNRRGISDQQGIENCVTILKKVAPLAEKHNVNICMELLNSKVDHPDYQCDHTAWGVEVCKRVNSPNMKLLFDIYHMQIMEGDIIRNIRDNIQYLGHFHTAGNPGRNEITGPSELDYKWIAQAIVDTGYKGYMSHEYSPRRDPQTKQPLENPLVLLNAALTLCDV